MSEYLTFVELAVLKERLVKWAADASTPVTIRRAVEVARLRTGMRLGASRDHRGLWSIYVNDVRVEPHRVAGAAHLRPVLEGLNDEDMRAYLMRTRISELLPDDERRPAPMF